MSPKPHRTARFRRVTGPILAVVLVLVLTLGCSVWRPAPPPSEPVRAVVLLPIHDGANRSAYSGVFTYYSWIADTRAAVPALLAAALRAELERRGIAVITAAAPAAPATLAEARAAARSTSQSEPMLFIAIDKWEADDTDFPDRVDVALTAALLAPSSGQTLWAAPDQAGPIATLGSTSLAAAYSRAAAQVAGNLVAGFRVQNTGP